MSLGASLQFILRKGRNLAKAGKKKELKSLRLEVREKGTREEYKQFLEELYDEDNRLYLPPSEEEAKRKGRKSFAEEPQFGKSLIFLIRKGLTFKNKGKEGAEQLEALSKYIRENGSRSEYMEFAAAVKRPDLEMTGEELDELIRIDRGLRVDDAIAKTKDIQDRILAGISDDDLYRKTVDAIFGIGPRGLSVLGAAGAGAAALSGTEEAHAGRNPIKLVKEFAKRISDASAEDVGKAIKIRNEAKKVLSEDDFEEAMRQARLLALQARKKKGAKTDFDRRGEEIAKELEEKHKIHKELFDKDVEKWLNEHRLTEQEKAYVKWQLEDMKSFQDFHEGAYKDDGTNVFGRSMSELLDSNFRGVIKFARNKGVVDEFVKSEYYKGPDFTKKAEPRPEPKTETKTEGPDFTKKAEPEQDFTEKAVPKQEPKAKPQPTPTPTPEPPSDTEQELMNQLNDLYKKSDDALARQDFDENRKIGQEIDSVYDQLQKIQAEAAKKAEVVEPTSASAEAPEAPEESPFKSAVNPWLKGEKKKSAFDPTVPESDEPRTLKAIENNIKVVEQVRDKTQEALSGEKWRDGKYEQLFKNKLKDLRTELGRRHAWEEKQEIAERKRTRNTPETAFQTPVSFEGRKRRNVIEPGEHVSMLDEEKPRAGKSADIARNKEKSNKYGLTPEQQAAADAEELERRRKWTWQDVHGARQKKDPFTMLFGKNLTELTKEDYRVPYMFMHLTDLNEGNWRIAVNTLLHVKNKILRNREAGLEGIRDPDNVNDIFQAAIQDKGRKKEPVYDSRDADLDWDWIMENMRKMPDERTPLSPAEQIAQDKDDATFRNLLGQEQKGEYDADLIPKGKMGDEEVTFPGKEEDEGLLVNDETAPDRVVNPEAHIKKILAKGLDESLTEGEALELDRMYRFLLGNFIDGIEDNLALSLKAIKEGTEEMPEGGVLALRKQSIQDMFDSHIVPLRDISRFLEGRQEAGLPLSEQELKTIKLSDEASEYVDVTFRGFAPKSEPKDFDFIKQKIIGIQDDPWRKTYYPNFNKRSNVNYNMWGEYNKPPVPENELSEAVARQSDRKNRSLSSKELREQEGISAAEQKTLTPLGEKTSFDDPGIDLDVLVPPEYSPNLTFATDNRRTEALAVAEHLEEMMGKKGKPQRGLETGELTLGTDITNIPPNERHAQNIPQDLNIDPTDAKQALDDNTREGWLFDEGGNLPHNLASMRMILRRIVNAEDPDHAEDILRRSGFPIKASDPDLATQIAERAQEFAEALLPMIESPQGRFNIGKAMENFDGDWDPEDIRSWPLFKETARILRAMDRQDPGNVQAAKDQYKINTYNRWKESKARKQGEEDSAEYISDPEFVGSARPQEDTIDSLVREWEQVSRTPVPRRNGKFYQPEEHKNKRLQARRMLAIVNKHWADHSTPANINEVLADMEKRKLLDTDEGRRLVKVLEKRAESLEVPTEKFVGDSKSLAGDIHGYVAEQAVAQNLLPQGRSLPYTSGKDYRASSQRAGGAAEAFDDEEFIRLWEDEIYRGEQIVARGGRADIFENPQKFAGRLWSGLQKQRNAEFHQRQEISDQAREQLKHGPLPDVMSPEQAMGAGEVMYDLLKNKKTRHALQMLADQGEEGKALALSIQEMMKRGGSAEEAGAIIQNYMKNRVKIPSVEDESVVTFGDIRNQPGQADRPVQSGQTGRPLRSQDKDVRDSDFDFDDYEYQQGSYSDDISGDYFDTGMDIDTGPEGLLKQLLLPTLAAGGAVAAGAGSAEAQLPPQPDFTQGIVPQGAPPVAIPSSGGSMPDEAHSGFIIDLLKMVQEKEAREQDAARQMEVEQQQMEIQKQQMEQQQIEQQKQEEAAQAAQNYKALLQLGVIKQLDEFRP